MKKEGLFNLVLVLGLVTFITAGTLGFVNEMTAPVIAANKAAAQTAAFADFFPDATFAEAEVPAGTTVVGGFIAYDASGAEIGKIVLATPTGFAGPIELAFGFDSTGAVVGYKVLASTETSGIGTRIADEEFWGMLMGLTDFSGVDTLAGATVSSSAALGAANDALAALGQLVPMS